MVLRSGQRYHLGHRSRKQLPEQRHQNPSRIWPATCRSRRKESLLVWCELKPRLLVVSINSDNGGGELSDDIDPGEIVGS